MHPPHVAQNWRKNFLNTNSSKKTKIIQYLNQTILSWSFIYPLDRTLNY